MKIFPLFAAAAVACALPAPEAFAQQKHYRGGHGYHHHHGHRYGPRYHAYGPYRPYWYWSAPLLAYTYPIYAPPVYAPPRVIVERVHEPAPPRYYERAQPYNVPPRAEAPQAAPAPKVAAIPEPRRERFTLSARELFEFDKATLRKPQPKLDEIAAVLKDHRHIYDVDIIGHTDRLGSEEYNLELSQRRAEAVKGYLVDRGVEARRLRASGKGEARPVVQCSDEDRAALIKCLEPNRRVEVESITVERSVPAS